MPNKYRFDITWSNEDDGYIATCYDFNGLSAFGEAPEEALSEAQTAIQLFIEAYQDKGLTLPDRP